METIDYKNFLGVANINNGKNQIKARVLDVDSNNSKALVETVDGSLRIKLNNKTGELLSVGDYVVVEYDKVLTKKNAYISLRNGQAVPATKVNIENAIVIQEKVASYLLHEYTIVDYVAGNKIMYGGISNPIILNGYEVYRQNIEYSASYSEIDFYHIYLSSLGHYRNDSKALIEISTIANDGTITANFKIVQRSTGENIKDTTVTTKDMTSLGIGLAYQTIYKPGTSNYPNGYIMGNLCMKYRDVTTGKIKYIYFSSYSIFFEFASISEYNAAIGLTYEPQTLSQVNETKTVV